MKITCILSLVFATSLFATEVHSQTAKATITQNEATVLNVIHQIEQQTDYLFIYNKNEIDVDRSIDLKVNNESVAFILSKLFNGTDVVYAMEGSNIFLMKKQETLSTLQQQNTVTGTVVDENGDPMPGVNIIVKGTTLGTFTDADGKYKLSVPTGDAVLEFTFIGYASQEVQLGDRTVIDIAMKPTSTALEEIVVVGYAVQKKVNLTGAVESVNVNKAKARAYTNVSAMLQGNVTGAFIAQNSGQPGHDDATIQIRGVGTFNNSSPLVIIDGMEGSLSSLNPKDIQSISVLKDAASCAIYGNRASNGVILITTKTGDENKMEIEYNGLVGVQKATSLPEVLTGLDYLELEAEAYYNTNKKFPIWYNDEYMNSYRNHIDEYIYPTDYSWIDETYKSAIMTDHYLSISGGNKRLRYSTSAGYMYQDGIIHGNNSSKFTFRGNVAANFLNNKLRINAGFSTPQRTVNDLVDGAGSAIYQSYAVNPTIRKSIPGVGYSNHAYNWGALEAGGFNRETSLPVTLRTSISADLFKGMTLQVFGGMDKDNSKYKIFKPAIQLYGFNSDGGLSVPAERKSNLYLRDSESANYTLNAQLSYNRNFAKIHDLGIMLGYEMREYSSNWHSLSCEDLTVNLPEFPVGDPVSQKNDSGGTEIAWMSYFGRLNYSLKNRYLFEFNLRYDGSSRFLDKWGLFPSVSAGWRLSEENFMKNISWIDNLKLRVSWGQLGNESIGQSYAASDELSLNGSYNLGNKLVGMAAIKKLANKKTSWETSEQYNIGIDFDLLKRISGSIEYYIKNTYDILMQVPISKTLGMSTTPYQNAGKMRNTGVELTIRYNDRIGQVRTHFTISGSRVKNEIKGLAGKDEIVMGTTIWRVGESFNSLFGVQTEGIYQSMDEINNHLIFNKNGVDVNPYYGMTPVPGDIRFKDQINVDTNGDGVPDARDGVIDDKDRTLIGNTFPKWTFSSNIGFDWNGFDVSMFLQGVAGNYAINQGMISVPFVSGSCNTGAWYKDRWTPENPSKTIQRLYSDPLRADIISEYYKENVSYLRCKSLDFGYTVSKKFLRRLFGNTPSIRLYATLQNLFTITKMRYGFDPEKPSTNTGTMQYPQTRIYSFGMNLKF